MLAGYNLVTDINYCPFEVFWVALLSNNQLIYQSAYNKEDSWLRLKQMCFDQNLNIINMGIASKNNVINIPMKPYADGYFYSKKSKLLVGPNFSSHETGFGVGYLDNNKLYIKWVFDSGIEDEVRMGIDNYFLIRNATI